MKATPHINKGEERHFGTGYRKTPLSSDKKGHATALRKGGGGGETKGGREVGFDHHFRLHLNATPCSPSGIYVCQLLFLQAPACYSTLSTVCY